MSTFYARLVEIALGVSPSAPILAVIPDPLADQGPAGKESGAYLFPRTCLPDASEVIVLPATETYPAALQNLLVEKKPERLFLAPPLLRQELVPPAIRAQYPRLDYEVIALQAALRALPDGATVAAIMPAGFLQRESSRSVRSQMFAHCAPKLLITHAHSLRQIGLESFSATFRMDTIVFGVGSADRCIRFFKCLDASDAGLHEDIVADLSRLQKQGGGQTKHGYVIREGLPPDAPLIHELYDPTFISRQQSIGAIGEVKRLGDLAEKRHVVRPALRSQLLQSVESGQGVAIVHGNQIGGDGQIHWEGDVGRWTGVPPELLLQEGDLCFPRICRIRDRIRAAEVNQKDLPCAASDSVLVLRIKPGLTPEQRRTLLAYLHSGHAAEQVNVRSGVSGTLRDVMRMDHVFDLPVPMLDKILTTALSDINESISLLRGWAEEAERSRDALFEFARPREDRVQFHAVGRLTRRRCDAARLVSDLRHRIRTRFPYPIAFRWRTAEVAQPDSDGLRDVLDCAETAVCYLACMCMLVPTIVAGFRVKHVTEMAKRMADTGHGTSMGDWIAVVREVLGAKAIRRQTDFLPFAELSDPLDEDANQALSRLANARNDRAHGRGPTGTEVKPVFNQCLDDLAEFLEGIEFITEYPLCLIERARRDTILKHTNYEYLELMGDHPLVPRLTGQTSQADLEESLYLADRSGALYLLRPFLNRLVCPECKRWSVFCLDRYSKQENKCFLKSMEHNHVVEDGSIVSAFKHVGMVQT